jgi:hypothetical protein
MTPDDDLVISITAAWNDGRSALVRSADLRTPHWCRPAGAPKTLLHAYVSCDRLVDGEVSHACDPSSAPHRVLVCVLKSHNTAAAYAVMARRAAAEQAAPELPASLRLVKSAVATHEGTW